MPKFPIETQFLNALFVDRTCILILENVNIFVINVLIVKKVLLLFILLSDVMEIVYSIKNNFIAYTTEIYVLFKTVKKKLKNSINTIKKK